jgi:hypothetical protein
MERENSAAVLAFIVVVLRTAQQLERLDAPGSLGTPIAVLRDAATRALEAVSQELS